MKSIVSCLALFVGAAILTGPANGQGSAPRCPVSVSADSLTLDVTKLSKDGGNLTIGYRVRNDYNVPMQITAYNWGNDVSRAYDSFGVEWPINKSASRQDRWANSSGQAVEPSRSTEGNIIFTKISGSVNSEVFDFNLNFSVLPAGPPGSGLGKTRMVRVKLKDVPVDCVE